MVHVQNSAQYNMVSLYSILSTMVSLYSINLVLSTMYQPTSRKWANVDGKILNASKNRYTERMIIKILILDVYFR